MYDGGAVIPELIGNQKGQTVEGTAISFNVAVFGVDSVGFDD